MDSVPQKIADLMRQIAAEDNRIDELEFRLDSATRALKPEREEKLMEQIAQAEMKLEKLREELAELKAREKLDAQRKEAELKEAELKAREQLDAQRKEAELKAREAWDAQRKAWKLPSRPMEELGKGPAPAL